MPNKFIISPPFPPQELFYRAKQRRIAYGGARGGGKSHALRTKLCLLALRYEGIQILLLRRSFPELRENHILPLRKMLSGIAEYRDCAKEFTFPNGSRIKLGYMATDADALQYQGQAYEVIAMDEATQFTEEQYTALTECNRLSGNVLEDFTPRMYFTCNPGGRGHAWVKRLFIDRAYKETESASDYVFIPARVYDNKYLIKNDPDYVRNLEALPPKRRKAMLEGDWDVFEGQFFDEWRNDPAHYNDGINTHVINPIPVKPSWRLFRSFDFGRNKPFACLWFALSEDNVAYIIHELYGCTGVPDEGVKWDADKIFTEIARTEEEHPYLRGKKIRGIADPACWQKTTGESVAEIATKHRVYFERGDNSRVNGWAQVHNRLTFDNDGMAMLYVFTTCKHTIRTIPLLLFDTHKVEDLDTAQEDHIADTIRYFCMAHKVPPRMPSDMEYVPVDDPLNTGVKFVLRKKGEQ